MSFDTILAAFAMESAEILEDVEEAVRDFGRGAEGALDRLFRDVHTIKGSSGIVGLDGLQAFCHAWESRLANLRREPPAPDSVAGIASALSVCRDQMAARLSSSTPAIGAEGARPADAAALTRYEEAALASLDTAIAGPEKTIPIRLPPEEAAATGTEARDGLEAAGQPAPGQATPGRQSRPVEPTKDTRRGEGYARVPAATLERILSLASEVAIALSNLHQSVLRSGDHALADEVGAVESVASLLYRNVLDTRMVPFADIAGRFRRAVEEIAGATGRHIAFELLGGDTEIEKSVADRLVEPILHLVRNAADHGIEAPERRRAAGKPLEGRVALGASREANLLSITVEDDGGGIDPEAIRARAVESGLLSQDARIGNEELMDFLFEPGFSLSRAVTRWSGRGVGLDVVKRSVENLRGSIRISSVFGRGSRVVVRLPVNLSLVDGFIAKVGELQLLVPFESAWSCLELPARARGSSAWLTLSLEGELVPAIDLGNLYGSVAADSGGEGRADAAGEGRRIAIRIDQLGTAAAIVVDDVGETLSAAVRPLDRRLADAPGIAGYAIRGDGSIMLVLDVAELALLAARSVPQATSSASNSRNG